MSEWADLLITILNYSIRLPLELALSPICLISSGLFDTGLRLLEKETTALLPYLLKLEALLTMGFIVSTIR